MSVGLQLLLWTPQTAPQPGLGPCFAHAAEGAPTPHGVWEITKDDETSLFSTQLRIKERKGYSWDTQCEGERTKFTEAKSETAMLMNQISN